ncbi:MAG: hypothetical protein ACRD6N_19865, partial [Pyrinomonadaceae bacterium]
KGGSYNMNHQPARLANTYSLIAAGFLLALAAPVPGQQPTGPPLDHTNAERQRQQDMSRREYRLRNLGIAPDGPPDRKQIEAIGAQIEQDFNRILILHNQIVRATSSKQVLDYGFVSDATAQIKKRASRLQSTLALRGPTPPHENSEKSTELDDAQLKSALLTLCKQIKSFVTNPVIETPGTVNVEQLAKARRDLESIIILSGHIKKDAEKLSKSLK